MRSRAGFGEDAAAGGGAAEARAVVPATTVFETVAAAATETAAVVVLALIALPSAAMRCAIARLLAPALSCVGAIMTADEGIGVGVVVDGRREKGAMRLGLGVTEEWTAGRSFMRLVEPSVEMPSTTVFSFVVFSLMPLLPSLMVLALAGMLGVVHVSLRFWPIPTPTFTTGLLSPSLLSLESLLLRFMAMRIACRPSGWLSPATVTGAGAGSAIFSC